MMMHSPTYPTFSSTAAAADHRSTQHVGYYSYGLPHRQADGQPRSYAWQHLLIARAIENQACVVGANRCGRAGNDVYDHQSFIFNHLGQPATGATPPPFCANIPGTEVLIATLSLDQIQKYRRAFPAAADADTFSIQP